MQMMSKNRNGITLISIVITIVVLMIILAITINYGLSEIQSASNKKVESELTIVQSAIMQRYALVKSKNNLGIIATPIIANTALEADTGRPKDFVGTRLFRSAEITANGFTGITLMQEYSSNESNLPYEKYYYLIDEADLKALGIEKGDNGDVVDQTSLRERSYIVNYFTGEIFDIANDKYYKTEKQNDDKIYTQPTSINMSEKEYNFNDD